MRFNTFESFGSLTIDIIPCTSASARNTTPNKHTRLVNVDNESNEFFSLVRSSINSFINNNNITHVPVIPGFVKERVLIATKQNHDIFGIGMSEYVWRESSWNAVACCCSC